MEGAAFPVEHEFEHRAYGSDEPLSEDEVQAIIERYGEGQSGGDGQATVKDVAEALHVEPSVVGRMLSDIRTADSSEQLRERLEALEQENAELRAHADPSEDSWSAFDCCTPWSYRRGRKPRSRFLIMILMVSLFVIIAPLMRAGPRFGPLGLIILILGCALLVKFLRSGRS